MSEVAKKGWDFAKDLMELNSNVKGLIKDVARLDEMCRDHETRLIKLEASAPQLEEMSKRVALEQVLSSFQHITTKVVEIEARIGTKGNGPSLPDWSRTEDGTTEERRKP